MKDILKAELLKYGPLTESEWHQIAEQFTLRKINKGEHYLRQGRICHKIGFVTNGLLRTYTNDYEGNEITTHFAHTGTYAVAFLSFKNQSPSLENIQAVDDTEVLEIGYQQLGQLFETSEKWAKIYAGFVEDAYTCMLERSYILQNYSAQEKYDTLIAQSHPDIIMKAHLGHISSYLGIKLETLSRIRKNRSAINI